MGVTMKDIAERLNLSINAVSLALNDKAGVSETTRTEILELAEEMGYLNQNKNKRYRKTFANRHIGVLILKRNYRTPFYSQILYGIEKEANAQGFYVLTKFLEDGNFWECLDENKFCGVIFVGNVEEEVLQRVAEYPFPVVLIDHTSYHRQFDCILTDNRVGTYVSVTYLLEQGYEKIGFIGDFHHSHSNRERYWGYMEALMARYQDLGRATQIANQYSFISEMDTYILNRDVDAIVNLIRDRELAQAYQCANDEAAIVLENALKTLGYRIPEDIAVIGFDDMDYAKLALPALTTLHVNKTRMGQEGVRKLVWRLEHGDAPVGKTVLPVEMILRNSTLRKE